ncbi:hypothetical protein G7046_g436 [Stylonectria norvegica]|nr:hypothetical protein G7046_g436 [Stylonectria norvegica]
MPQTTARSTPLLGIALQDGGASYAPGDTIHGYVYRKSPVVSPDASITISLYGRAKSKITVHRGNSTSTYRGRAPLVSERTTRQMIHRGPFHIPSGDSGHKWSFSMVIPTHGDRQLIPELSPSKRFLPNDRAYALPSTFCASHSNREGYVEYYLEAELLLTGKGTIDSQKATQPVTIRSLIPGPPRNHSELKVATSYHQAASQLLEPGVTAADLTFSQKMKKAFNTSSVPTVNFRLEVGVPTVLQLNNPNHISFQVRAIPNWSLCSESIKNKPQVVTLQWLSMTLAAHTELKFDSGSYSHPRTRMSTTVDLSPGQIFQVLAKNGGIPFSADLPPVDIGELTNFTLGYGRCEYPSFTTYNIEHTHVLKWQMRFGVAGESFKASGKENIRVLPPADTRPGTSGSPTSDGTLNTTVKEAWIQPPAEEDAPPPPTFEQVKEEDAAQGVVPKFTT